MSVKITGVQRMLDEIEQSVGQKAMQAKAERGIKSGGEIIYKNMQKAMYSFRDTGASGDEIKISNVDIQGNDIKVFIYWKGPQKRYTIIHLNEHGYMRNGRKQTTRGHGAIARALRQSQTAYFRAVEKELSR